MLLPEPETANPAAAAAAYRRAVVFDAARARSLLLAKVKAIAMAHLDMKADRDHVPDRGGVPMLPGRDIDFAVQKSPPADAADRAVRLLRDLHVWREHIRERGEVLARTHEGAILLTRADLALAAKITASERR